MNKLLTSLISTIALSLFAAGALASSLNIADTNMQHYVFTYHVNKYVDPINHQYNETRQEISYVLALDIQRQVYRNLDTITGLDDLYLDGLNARVSRAALQVHPLHSQYLAL